MCYHTKFRRYRSNRSGAGRSHKNVGDAGAPPPCDVGLAHPLETTRSRIVRYSLQVLYVNISTELTAS